MALGRLRSKDNPIEDGDGFVRFYQRHAQPLVVFFARRVYDPEAAFDLAAETFAQAFASRSRFRGQSHEEMAAWLYAIARHQLTDYLRRGKTERTALEKLGVQVPELSPDEFERIEELADLPALRAGVAAGLAAVSDDHREALQLRVVDALPYPEVARRLGVTEPTARARVSRGLRALGRSLSPQLTPEEPA